jgi:hypothetical protein
MVLNSVPPFRTLLLSISIIFAACFVFPSQAFSKREHLVYFPNTAYELNIYKIFGKNPGKTLMLIGGIQGNEPGGFLSADLYADMSLEKGNLIVVPRANFYSIILNKRGPNGDMNRKFSPKDISSSMEGKIVTILKDLISESDYLLNLHDGAGYYYPEYINKWRNPMRFGQSIIADCDEFKVPGSKRVIKLGDMAQKVIEDVNPHIKNDLYKFHFMNTKTFDKDSPHSEQRMSATYYALVEHHIPAFGVETSKFLPSIDLKVRYHNLVINAFKKIFDIVPESPGLVLDPAILKYVVVTINGQTPIVINNKQTLQLAAGDSIRITHIEANYERGLSLDILGYGGVNDYRKDFPIYRNTSLIVRKDNHTFAELPIRISKNKPVAEKKVTNFKRIDSFVVETRGHRMLVSNGETLEVTRGDTLKIVDVLPSTSRRSGIKVNFKGFVGDRKGNSGEDRGYVIDTGTALMKKWSVHKRDEYYEVVVTRGNAKMGRLVVRLMPPKMEYLILKVNSHQHLFLRPEGKISLSEKDQISLEEIHTNLYSKKGIHLSFNGHKLRQGDVRKLNNLGPTHGYRHHQVTVKKGRLVLGKIFFEMN